MAKRILQQYFKITQSVPANNNASRKEARDPQKNIVRTAMLEQTTGNRPVIPVNTPVLKKLQDFFDTEWTKWLKDAFYHKPYQYPINIQNSPVKISSANGAGNPITIGVAADWANDTEQSQFIGLQIAKKGLRGELPDYTIHVGDTYYSGTAPELNTCFGAGNGDEGLWPRGKLGTFVLAGNHEMYSNGQAYFDMIRATNRNLGIGGAGHEPVFCLETDHWLILGLDTGYDCLSRKLLFFTGTNTNLNLPQQVIDWLKNIVSSNQNKGIIVLTHHQYITAFGGEDEFLNPAAQLNELLPNREVIWIWGHEHRFSIYGKYRHSPQHIQAYGRCIGNGGMPDEHTNKRKLNADLGCNRKLVVYDQRTADKFPLDIDPVSGGTVGEYLEIGYNGYAIITLDKSSAKIEYYASYKGDNNVAHTQSPGIPDVGIDQLVFTEIWDVDNATGVITCTAPKDGTPRDGVLTYFDTKGPADVGK